jgi:4-phospho-D-threonate 3-dehydrogenase / 4-phospho-D-erythronate 3-dehydrogenase
MSQRPIIGLSMGDPAGIGPEICLRAIRDPRVLNACVPVIFGDIEVLLHVAACTGLVSPPSSVVSLSTWPRALTEPAVVDCGAIRSAEFTPGTVSKACGLAAVRYIEAAVEAAKNGATSAIVTAPIHKDAIRLAGSAHPGHTEMIAQLTGARRTCMMMASDELMVSLATIHVGLARVASTLTVQRVLDAIELTGEMLRRIGKKTPRILVCGLNPHSGENGMFGREEAEIVEPAVAAARRAGWCVEGPLAADTAFVPGRRATADAHVAMYHDQGLIPFKMLAFDTGVNITLGLPIVRTSVDHGTAFDLAWKGRASETSLVHAILWAVRLL